MNHEIFGPAEEPKENPLLLSQRIEQELRRNPYISVAGRISRTTNSMFQVGVNRLFGFNREPFTIRAGDNNENIAIANNVDIFCGLKQPSYAPQKLNSILEKLTPINPMKISKFDIYSDNLMLGEAYYEERLGQVSRTKSHSLSIDQATKQRLKNAGIGYEDQETKTGCTQEVFQRTYVHLYPDMVGAEFAHLFLTNRGTINERLRGDMIWTLDDATEAYFKELTRHISAPHLRSIFAGKHIKDIYYEQLKTEQKEAQKQYWTDLEIKSRYSKDNDY